MTTKNQLLKVIRKQCVECMGGQVGEIEKCTAPKCSLFSYRSGHDPEPNAGNVERGRKNCINLSREREKSPANQGVGDPAMERIG
jgi:hypothetical protein